MDNSWTKLPRSGHRVGSESLIGKRSTRRARRKKRQDERSLANTTDGRKSTPTPPAWWAAFSSSDTYRMKGPTFSIFVRLATRSGKSFTAGLGIGWKI